MLHAPMSSGFFSHGNLPECPVGLSGKIGKFPRKKLPKGRSINHYASSAGNKFIITKR